MKTASAENLKRYKCGCKIFDDGKIVTAHGDGAFTCRAHQLLKQRMCIDFIVDGKSTYTTQPFVHFYLKQLITMKH